MRHALGSVAIAGLALGLIGCQAAAPGTPPTPAPQVPALSTPKPVFSPAPRPVASQLPGVPADWPTLQGGPGRYVEDFDGANPPLGDWKDPRDEGHSYPWLYSGNWNLAAAFDPLGARRRPGISAGGRAWEFNDMRPQPMLSFRRYAGKAFGTPDGELPERYSVNLTVTALASRDDFYPPIGDQGTPVYYVDPTHYVEVLLKPERFEVWECNGGEPLKWHGWRQLYDEPASHSAGVGYVLGAEVDARKGTLRVYHRGSFRREVRSEVVRPYTHYFALRAGSNRVQFDDLVIQSP